MGFLMVREEGRLQGLSKDTIRGRGGERGWLDFIFLSRFLSLSVSPPSLIW